MQTHNPRSSISVDKYDNRHRGSKSWEPDVGSLRISTALDATHGCSCSNDGRMVGQPQDWNVIYACDVSAPEL